MKSDSLMYFEKLNSKILNVVEFDKVVSRLGYNELNHRVLVYDVPENVYNFVKHVVSELSHDLTLINVNQLINNININYTVNFDTTTMNKFYVVSGSISNWCKFINFCEMRMINTAELSALIKVVKRDAGITIDYDENYLIQSDELYEKISCIKDYDVLRVEERLIHEVANIRISCDKNSLMVLKSIHNCIVSEVKPEYDDNSTHIIKPEEHELFWNVQSKLNNEVELCWDSACMKAVVSYNNLVYNGVNESLAKKVLPIGMQSDVLVSATLIDWRDFCLSILNNTFMYEAETLHLVQNIYLDLKKSFKFIFKRS